MGGVFLRCRNANRSGSIAVEFAFIAPILMAMLFGIVAFGMVISINNGIQQLVAEAARASVAGLSDTERASLAQAYVGTNASAYPFIKPSRLTLNTSAGPSTFQVSITYDMSDSVAFAMPKFIPLPSPVVTRSAVVQTGSF